MDKSLVSVVIVNWNGKRYLEDCLSTLLDQTYPAKEVIVVDNGSIDGSVEFIRQNYPASVTLLVNTANLGFAEANNIGIRKARGKYVLTLNNDTMLDKNCLEELVKVIESDDKLGMCVPKILMQSDPKRLDGAGHLLYYDGISRSRGRLEIDRGQYDALTEVIFPSACCGLYLRSMLEEIGMFDKDFFIYVEDTDMGLRARLAGYGCVYVPSAVVFHRYSGSVGAYSKRKAFLVERNRIWVVVKLFPVPLIILSFYYTLLRYVYQFYGIVSNIGSAAIFTRENSLAGIIILILKAYFSAFLGLPKVVAQRIRFNPHRKVGIFEFYSWFKKFGITARELALKE